MTALMIKEITLKLLNEEGMHARPAGILVKTASQFKSKIEIQYNGKTVNAKSVLGLMSLGMTGLSDFVIKADGSDAEGALLALQQLVQNKFQV
jgi:phosphocarrier protein HPr